MPKRLLRHATYSNVVATLALFLVLAGGAAVAASDLGKHSVGTLQLKPGAVKAGTLDRNSVTTGKIAPRAVTQTKLADGAAINRALAAGAVTADKLVDSERSQAFNVRETASQGEVPVGLFGDFDTTSPIVTANLPTGQFVTIATAGFLAVGSEYRLVDCLLYDDGTVIAEGNDSTQVSTFFPSAHVTLVGISDGGTVRLRCRASGDGIRQLERRIVGIRVGSVG